MSNPILHLIAGPNGAGKTTFYNNVMAPIPLPFVNAHLIAAQQWPGEEHAHAGDAALLAEMQREQKLADGESFAETVFSHEWETRLVADAVGLGYLVTLHIIIVPAELAVARVANRVTNGGHSVDETKIRDRYKRLWSHVRPAIILAATTHIYDNSQAADPFRLVATYRGGVLVVEHDWPSWTPRGLD